MCTKTLLAALFIAALSMPAHAGKTQPAPVTIDFDNRIAQGDMVTARFSSNPEELIGCGVRKIKDGTELVEFAFCQARISETENILCNTFDPDIIEAIASISDFSYVTFSWNEANECIRIGNSTQSFYIPNFRLKRR